MHGEYSQATSLNTFPGTPVDLNPQSPAKISRQLSHSQTSINTPGHRRCLVTLFRQQLLMQNESLRPAFRVSAKNFLLTWAKCDCSKEAILQHLQAMQASYVCVSRELHSDGSPHAHAFVLFPKKRNIKDPTHFNIQGFQANICSVRNASAAIEYVKKGNQ